MARARISAMVAADPVKMEKALDWFDGLPVGQAKAVLKALAER
jgi:hypothetical protein